MPFAQPHFIAVQNMAGYGMPPGASRRSGKLLAHARPCGGRRPVLLAAGDAFGNPEFTGLEAGAQSKIVGQKLNENDIDQRPEA